MDGSVLAWGAQAAGDCSTSPEKVACDKHIESPLERLPFVFPASVGGGVVVVIVVVGRNKNWGPLKHTFKFF